MAISLTTRTADKKKMTCYMILDLAGQEDPGLVGPPLLLHHSLDPAANKARTTSHQHNPLFRLCHPAPAHRELPPGQASLHSRQHLPFLHHSWSATWCRASLLPRRKNREQPSVVSAPPEPFPSSSLAARRSSVFTAFARAALQVGSSSYGSM